MKDCIEVFIFNDQPTNCPICGLRTEIILDLYDTIEQTQFHQCLNDKCKFEFVMQKDDKK